MTVKEHIDAWNKVNNARREKEARKLPWFQRPKKPSSNPSLAGRKENNDGTT